MKALIGVLMLIGAGAEFVGIWLVGQELRRARQAADDFETHLEETRKKYGFTRLRWWQDSVELAVHQILDEDGQTRRVVSFGLLLAGVVLTFAAGLLALLRT